MQALSGSSELLRLLGIDRDAIGATRVTGSVAADQRHRQPWGIVHGGLYTSAIETFATMGAYEAVNDRGQQAVGVSNCTDFLRPHRSGRLNVEATAISGRQRIRMDDGPEMEFGPGDVAIIDPGHDGWVVG